MTPTVRHPAPPPRRCWHCDRPIYQPYGASGPPPADHYWIHSGEVVTDHDAEPDPAIALEAKLADLTEGMSDEDAAVYDC